MNCYVYVIEIMCVIRIRYFREKSTVKSFLNFKIISKLQKIVL